MGLRRLAAVRSSRELELEDLAARRVLLRRRTPPGSGAPGFVEYDAGFYGHGDLGGLGVKVAPDFAAPDVEPDTLERVPSPELEHEARALRGRAVPRARGGAAARRDGCASTTSPATRTSSSTGTRCTVWWLVGGGSGHGFKHGPALAEYVADCIEGKREPESFHALGPAHRRRRAAHRLHG